MFSSVAGNPREEGEYTVLNRVSKGSHEGQLCGGYGANAGRGVKAARFSVRQASRREF